ncbi:FAD-dependent monooxygenase [Leptospira sp. GIMC2001]|uniref:FAD-dependent monooxygenase n=1 Tax=Leptospira sp. GIMC2001 TaxID=1513297 RepID=UPI00234B5DFD|nr:FAD-dependent monooxygenase [Leptospira sp. GIMC2001]WCL47774.1 FAD-dependent monooxygenase [Leptospira sp. GIMC2001]
MLNQNLNFHNSKDTIEESVDVLIVGAGPAGLSLALHLIQKSLDWVPRIIIIEKRIHPRKKLCGGALSIPAMEVLENLQIEPPNDIFSVNEIRVRYGNIGYSLKGKPVLKIVNRASFDHFLLENIRAKGVKILEDTTFLSAKMNSNGYNVETSRGRIDCRTLVGADGSSSLVRKSIGLKYDNTVCRLLEVLTPCRKEDEYLFDQKFVDLDFRSMRSGMQGYYWDFPSIVNGQRMINRGIFDSRTNTSRVKADLKNILQDSLLKRGIHLENCDLQGHPLHSWENKIPISRENALLIGDAAGGDPLFGEGISFALGYGQSAATVIEKAFMMKIFTFDDYSKTLLRNNLFRHLKFRSTISKIAYSIESNMILKFGWILVSIIFKIFRFDNPFYIKK